MSSMTSLVKYEHWIVFVVCDMDICVPKRSRKSYIELLSKADEGNKDYYFAISVF